MLGKYGVARIGSIVADRLGNYKTSPEPTSVQRAAFGTKGGGFNGSTQHMH